MCSTSHTQQECQAVMAKAKEVFAKKLHDYGAAWRVMRPATVTDQILIKAARLRSLQEKGEARVDESPDDAFIAIVNYSIIALIQCAEGAAPAPDMDAPTALEHYDRWAETSLNLMQAKNHDYDEAWRSMRVSSMTDLIYMKLLRIKQIEYLQGNTLASEGVDAGYMDMLNYAVFCLIRLYEADGRLEAKGHEAD